MKNLIDAYVAFVSFVDTSSIFYANPFWIVENKEGKQPGLIVLWEEVRERILLRHLTVFPV